MKIMLQRNLARHNVRWCFHNVSYKACVGIMLALLQWNILLHYVLKIHLEITKVKEMTIFFYIFSEFPTDMYRIIFFYLSVLNYTFK